MKRWALLLHLHFVPMVACHTRILHSRSYIRPLVGKDSWRRLMVEDHRRRRGNVLPTEGWTICMRTDINSGIACLSLGRFFFFDSSSTHHLQRSCFFFDSSSTNEGRCGLSFFFFQPLVGVDNKKKKKDESSIQPTARLPFGLVPVSSSPTFRLVTFPSFMIFNLRLRRKGEEEETDSWTRPWLLRSQRRRQAVGL